MRVANSSTVRGCKNTFIAFLLLPRFRAPFWLTHILVYLFYLQYVLASVQLGQKYNKQTRLWLRQKRDMETR